MTKPTSLIRILLIQEMDVFLEILYNVLEKKNKQLKERLPALVRDLFTFSSKVIKSFIIV
jgi:hypothetical protein